VDLAAPEEERPREFSFKCAESKAAAPATRYERRRGSTKLQDTAREDPAVAHLAQASYNICIRRKIGGTS